jgi:lysozyme
MNWRSLNPFRKTPKASPPTALSPEGLQLVKTSEGLRLHAYLDSTGKPTIGYGHTNGVTLGMSITEAQADKYLLEDIQSAMQIVTTWVKPPLNQNQFDALTDFVFNIGPGVPHLRDGFVWLMSGAHSTLLNKLNAQNWNGAAAELLKWNHAGGQVLDGLTTRRKKEYQMFLGT